MSKDYIKEFLDKFSEAESCDTSQNDACNIVGDLNDNIDKMDLRFNKNKEKVFKSLDNLNNQEDCNLCDASIGLFVDLSERWKKNKLKY
jgi:hypothetical protein